MPSGNRLSRSERLYKRAELELGLRTCSICFLQKPLTAFYRKLDKPFLTAACRDCISNKYRRKHKPDPDSDSDLDQTQIRKADSE